MGMLTAVQMLSVEGTDPKMDLGSGSSHNVLAKVTCDQSMQVQESTLTDFPTWNQVIRPRTCPTSCYNCWNLT